MTARGRDHDPQPPSRAAGTGTAGAQQGPGTVIRSLPQRTGGCLESDRVAG